MHTLDDDLEEPLLASLFDDDSAVHFKDYLETRKDDARKASKSATNDLQSVLTRKRTQTEMETNAEMEPQQEPGENYKQKVNQTDEAYRSKKRKKE